MTFPCHRSGNGAQMLRRGLPGLLLVLAVACGGDDTDGDATTTTVDEVTTTSTTAADGDDESALTERCSYEEAGWEITVSYPDDWVTNDETEFDHGTVPACRLFDPDDATPPRPNELTGFGVVTYVDPVEYSEARASDPLDAEVLEEEALTVAGRDATRREDRLTEDGIRGPQGARVTTYIVDLDGSIFVASTTEVDDLDYETNRDVLDEMLEHLELDRT